MTPLIRLYAAAIAVPFAAVLYRDLLYRFIVSMWGGPSREASVLASVLTGISVGLIIVAYITDNGGKK